MGTTNSNNTLQKLDQNQWTPIGTDYQVQIMKSNKGQGQGQLRYINLDPKYEPGKQQKIYQYRKQTESPLVQCLAVAFLKSQHKTVCGNQQDVKVITERIGRKLGNIDKLTFSEALYVLSESFRGFQDLTSKAGVFQITDKMIGVNNKGQLKVWLNQNFAENHPTFQKPILQTTFTTPEQLTQISNQQKMLKTVLDLVQKKVVSKYPEDFKQQVYRSKNFYEGYNSLHDYIKNKGFFVPGKLGAVQSVDRDRQFIRYEGSQDYNKNLDIPITNSHLLLNPSHNSPSPYQLNSAYTKTISERDNNKSQNKYEYSTNTNNGGVRNTYLSDDNNDNNNNSNYNYNYNTTTSNNNNNGIGNNVSISSNKPNINIYTTHNHEQVQAPNTQIHRTTTPNINSYQSYMQGPAPLTTINYSYGNSYGYTYIEPAKYHVPGPVVTIQPNFSGGYYGSKVGLVGSGVGGVVPGPVSGGVGGTSGNVMFRYNNVSSKPY